MCDEEEPRQEDAQQPQQEGVKDEREFGGHDDEQHDAMQPAVKAVAALTDLIAAEIRPSATHVELVVTIVASRQDDPERQVEYLAWLRPLDDAGKELTRTDFLGHFAEQVRDRVTEGAVGLVTNPVWEQLIQRWQTPDYGGIGNFAGQVADWDHELLRECLENAGVPGSLDAAIVFVVPLPGDRVLSVASNAIKVVGIAFAVATGHVAWACASFQSLVHDELLGELGKLIEGAAAEWLDSAAQAVGGPAVTTGLVEAAAEPAPAASESLPEVDRLAMAMSIAAAPGASLPGPRPDEAIEDLDATAPSFGPGAPPSEATGDHDAIGPAFGI